MKFGLPKKIGASSENLDSAIFGRPLRGNEEEFWEN